MEYSDNTGEDVCGGPRENIIDEDTWWKRLLLTAEQSMFGSGFASYRRNTNGKKYVKSLFHAAYRNEVLKKVGGFNEKLIRTEDNEFHYRIRRHGFKICYDPSIHSYYQTRNSLNGMLKQKYMNGLWIGKTVLECPGCVSVFHLVPFAFVMAILITLIAYLFGLHWPLIVLVLSYAVANAIMTLFAMTTMKKPKISVVLLPLIFFLLHVFYGAGTLVGLLSRDCNE